jgi:hypothetical protein
MKKIYLLVFLSLFLNKLSFGQSVCVWSGATSTDFFTNSNWVGGVAPVGGLDEVLFNSTSNNCDIGTDISLKGFTITSGYTGTISLNTTQLYLDIASFSQDGGTFNAGSTTIYIDNGDFLLSGGTFISSSDITDGLTILGGSIFKTGGTFTSNGGIVVLQPKGGSTYTVGSNITFNVLEFQTQAPNNARTLVFGTSVSTSDLNIINTSSSHTMNIQGNLNITSALNLTGAISTASPSANTGTLSFTGAGPITITSGNTNNLRGKLPNMLFNTTGTVTMTGFLNVQGNWIHDAGTFASSTSTVFFSGTSSILGTALNGAARNLNSLFVLTTGNLTVPTSTVNHLVVGGTFSIAGTTNLSSAGVGFAGTGALSSATTKTLNFLRVTSNSSAALNTTVTVTNFVKLESNALLTTNNNLILPSTSSVKGHIAAITTGTITGNVTMHTFISSGLTGWSLLGSPGLANQTFASWQNNPLPMVCTGCTYLPASYNNFHSLQSCDGNTFVTNVTLGTVLTPGVGFLVYVGTTASNTPSPAMTLTNTGAPVTGSFAISVPSGTSGFALLANPYPSAIAPEEFLNVNSLNSPVVYVYDADIDDYVMLGFSGDVLPSGQGFFADAGGGSATTSVTVTFQETMKVDDASASVMRSAGISQFKLNLQGATKTDQTIIRFHNEATSGYDKKYDARRIPYFPPYTNNLRITTVLNGEELMMNTLPVLTRSASIPVLTKVVTAGTFTISMSDIQNYSSCVILKDNYTGAYHDLNKAPYVTTISDTTKTARFQLLICEDPSSGPTSITEFSPVKFITIGQDAKGINVGTSFPERTSAVISVYNLIGQKIMEDVSVEGTETNTLLDLDVHNQVVIVKVTSNREVATRKVIVH